MAQENVSRLNKLRNIAQQHLVEIESEKQQEQQQASQADAEIQRYAKIPSFDRKKQQSSLTEQTNVAESLPAKQRFRPFQEILHRLRWDPALNLEEYLVGYVERFEGIKEMPASHWIKEFTEEDWIPMHRVRYVKRHTRHEDDDGPEIGVVWNRDNRLDMFASSELQEDLISVDGTSVSGGMPLR